MRTGLLHGGGLPLLKSPNARQQANRRRIVVWSSVIALVAASSLIGAAAQHAPAAPHNATTGPFSYISTE